jgi:transcriptional regulator with XRE-family HTH domain
MVDIRRNFGTRVRELRTARGLSQEAFAHQAGINRTYLGDIERGQRNVSLENIHRIAVALGLSLSELFQGVSNR